MGLTSTKSCFFPKIRIFHHRVFNCPVTAGLGLGLKKIQDIILATNKQVKNVYIYMYIYMYIKIYVFIDVRMT